METKFKVYHLASDRYYIIDNAIASADEQGTSIATTVTIANVNGLDNALLFAAAPDMLETLKKIESHTACLQKGVNKAGNKQISEVWSLATDAIKRAKE